MLKHSTKSMSRFGRVTLGLSMILFSGLLSSTKLIAADAPPSAPDHQVCFSISEAGRIRRAQADLELTEQNLASALADLKAARLKQPSHLGWSFGCGGGLAYDLPDQKTLVAPVCSVQWGWRF